MLKIIAITVLVVLASVAADPLLFSAPYVSPYLSAPLTSAAYVTGPSAAVIAAPAAVSAAVPAAVPAAIPAAVPAAYPYSTVSAYSYGSSYSVQDYAPTLVNSAAPLAYSLPYAYAADYFYRR